jgi:hypothetical protein
MRELTQRKKACVRLLSETNERAKALDDVFQAREQGKRKHSYDVHDNVVSSKTRDLDRIVGLLDHRAVR